MNILNNESPNPNDSLEKTIREANSFNNIIDNFISGTDALIGVGKKVQFLDKTGCAIAGSAGVVVAAIGLGLTVPVLGVPLLFEVGLMAIGGSVGAGGLTGYIVKSGNEKKIERFRNNEYNRLCSAIDREFERLRQYPDQKDIIEKSINNLQLQMNKLLNQNIFSNLQSQENNLVDSQTQHRSLPTSKQPQKFLPNSTQITNEIGEPNTPYNKIPEFETSSKDIFKDIEKKARTIVLLVNRKNMNFNDTINVLDKKIEELTNINDNQDTINISQLYKERDEIRFAQQTIGQQIDFINQILGIIEGGKLEDYDINILINQLSDIEKNIVL